MSYSAHDSDGSIPQPPALPEVSILDLDMWSSCRWPMGDPRAEGFRYCGMARRPHDHSGSSAPYCEQHWRLSRQGAGGAVQATRRIVSADLEYIEA